MEGGAMRGMFTAGVIDVFMENGIDFDGAIGVSAGATFGCNFKSRQIGRPVRYNKRFAGTRDYASLYSLLTTRDLYNAKFCYETLPWKLDIWDVETYRKNPLEFYVVCTDCETGKAVYKRCMDGGDRDIRWIRASASMPVLSRVVVIGKKHLLDGGVADSIPLKFFQHKGYDRNVVILTQPKGYVKEANKLMPIIRLAHGNYPKLVEAMADRHIRYNKCIAEIERQEAEGKVLVIRPEAALEIGSMEKDPEELERVYQEGRKVALKRLEEIRSFLNEEAVKNGKQS